MTTLTIYDLPMCCSSKLRASFEAIREEVRIAQAVKLASSENVVMPADRVLGADVPQAAAPAWSESAKAGQALAQVCR